jgi:hypothetical protein
MSSEQDQVRLIAERIARHLAQSSSSSSSASSSQQAVETSDVDNELATLRASLSQLQQRLAQVESQMKEEGGERVGSRGSSVQRAESSGASRRGETQHAPPTHSPWLSGVYVPAAHPSDERFGVAEAAVSELVDFFEKEKTCSIEPGNKPCDHCAMCSSRGF